MNQGNAAKDKGESTRALFMEGLREHGKIEAACRIAGVTRSAYDKWRQRIPDFAERADAIRHEALQRGDQPWDGSFASFRGQFFDHMSPWFHIQAIDAYENTPPGNLTVILWPPEHGKTTLAEDYFCYKLATNPEFRITVGSEGQDMARKILGRIRSRMEPLGPYPRYVAKFGPFVPQNQSGRKTAQSWGADYFDVFKKQRHDERDRVGEDDFYERVMEEIDSDLLQVIKFPAIITGKNGEPEPLWPEMFTMEKLDRIRRKVGEDAWSRNYMQEPSSSMSATFTDDAIQKCLNPLRSVNHEPPKDCSVYIGLDPALGSNNCVVAATPHEGKLKILFIREDTGLTRNEQILSVVEEAVLQCMRNGASVSDVVIEAMVFQKGLSRDERLIEMTQRYGFRVREHLTGVNKYNETIGVPSMALSFMRGDIDIPYADDKSTRHMVDQLIRQLKAWRPLKRGTRLRQDQVMALWFIWILWRQRKQSFDVDSSQFNFKGLPWKASVSSSKVF